MDPGININTSYDLYVESGGPLARGYDFLRYEKTALMQLLLCEYMGMCVFNRPSLVLGSMDPKVLLQIFGEVDTTMKAIFKSRF